MNSILNEPEPDVWPQVAPLLDEAVAQLAADDRNAVVLRYYQQKPLEEVGRVLGLNADAAQKRVSRALEKLRKFFAKRGVDSTPEAIARSISTHSGVTMGNPSGYPNNLTCKLLRCSLPIGDTIN